MQLSRAAGYVAMALVLATAGHAGADTGAGAWTVALDGLVATDTDNVIVVSPQLSVRHRLDEDGSEVRARAAVDVVSAASVDVVSQATRGFFETREESSLGATYAFSGVRAAFDYRFSIEPDYISNGASASVSTNLRSPDTVLSLGYGATYDVIGLRSTPYSVWSKALWIHRADASLTQTLGENTLLRAVYSLTVDGGFLEKAYRYVPLFTAGGLERAQADGVELGLDNFDAYRLPERVPENVPDRRIGHAVGLRLVQYVAAIDASLRLDAQVYLDSWGLAAFTTQPTLTFDLSEHVSLAAFGRLYLQSAVSFWQRVYVVSADDAVPYWRTLNRELSPYTTSTGGARFEWRGDPLMFYVEGSVSYTSFHDFLFLDHRTSLLGLVGLRWTL